MPSPSVRAPAKKPDVSPLLNSPHRRLVEKVFESARSNPSPAITALAQVPALPGDDQNAKLDKVLHSRDSLTTFIKNEVVTRAHLDSFYSQQMQVIEDRVKQATEPLQEQLVVMQTRLSKLEASFQIGSGSSGRRAASERPRGSDPAFRTIVFKGIREDVSAVQRLNDIEAFLKVKFPNVRIRDIGNYFKGAYPNGRSLTRAAYAELSSADVCREVLDAIGGFNDKPIKLKCCIGGEEVTIKKAVTEQAMQRNSALRRAADVLKADPRVSGKTAKIEWIKERGVTIDKIFAFQQSSSDLAGQFVGEFSDLRLP